MGFTCSCSFRVLSENWELWNLPVWVAILNKYTNRIKALMIASVTVVPPPTDSPHPSVKGKNYELLHQTLDYRKLSEVK